MKTVILAMSGGIDSSVSLFLLKKWGYNVRGVTMQNGSMSQREIEDARQVASQNEVEWELVNVEKEFREMVECDFIESYALGLTPNPCALCNRRIKFGFLFEQMREKYGDVYYATGHYARIVREDDEYFFSTAADVKKDQSYFLSSVKKSVLSRIIFPLADLTKAEVRKIALENDIKTAKKPDSQEICFIKDDDYRKYLTEQGIESKSGAFVLSGDGMIIGEHKGTFNYTIGQRKGLGISYSEKLFVKNIDIKRNTVMLDIHQNMYHSGLIADDLNFYKDLKETDEYSEKMIKCKVRSNSSAVNASVRFFDGKVEVRFAERQFAVSPGQLCVIYDADKIILSGRIIQSVENFDEGLND